MKKKVEKRIKKETDTGVYYLVHFPCLDLVHAIRAPLDRYGKVKRGKVGPFCVYQRLFNL